MADFLTLTPDYSSGNVAAPLDLSASAADISLTGNASPSAQYASAPLGFLPAGALGHSSSVFTAPAATANDDIFSNFNKTITSIAGTAQGGLGLYNTIQQLAGGSHKQTLIAPAAPQANSPAYGAGAQWIKGIPNSVVIVGGVGLLILVGVIAIK